MTRPLPEPYETTERFKDRIRACVSIREVNETVREIARDVKAHEAEDASGVWQIKNLAEYQRLAIQNGWVRKGEE